MAHLEVVKNGRVPPAAAGVLVDEEFGASVARKAKAEGTPLAMPVERSGQDEFQFEYGDDFGQHIEAFDPTFAKVLVRYNPEGDVELNKRQNERLARLSRWLREHERKFLFELLVPPTTEQLDRYEDTGTYDKEMRPSLVVEVIHTLQTADVEPDVWKIEGLDLAEDCQKVVTQARSGGRDGVACIILGRGADEAKVLHWLRVAASVQRLRRVRRGANHLVRRARGIPRGTGPPGTMQFRTSPGDTRRCTTPTLPPREQEFACIPAKLGDDNLVNRGPVTSSPGCLRSATRRRQARHRMSSRTDRAIDHAHHDTTSSSRAGRR